MISHLEIKGFKSLVDVSIDLGLVNVFIGANGSGKSNLLEAVGVLSAIVSGSLQAESIHYRGVRVGTPATFISALIDHLRPSISIQASDLQTSYSVDFSPDNENASKWAINRESVDFDNVEVLKRTSKGVSVLVGEKSQELPVGGHSSSDSVSPFLRLYFAFNKNKFQSDENSPDIPYISYFFFDELRGYGIFSPSTPQLRGFNEDSRREPLGLGGEGLGRAILGMLKTDPEMLGPFYLEDVFELIDWADSFQVANDSEQPSSIGGGPIRLRLGDRYMGSTHKSISLLEASEGALYVLFMLALVGHDDGPKLFAVDNFDQALHPRLACALTQRISDQILEDGSRQILATTHNPLVLDGLDLLDDRIRLFTVDRDASGATRIDRVLVTEELIDKGFSLSRLWTTGRLGGVPRAL